MERRADEEGFRVSASGTAAAGQVEHMMRQVTPGRYESYESLLHALSEGRLWMLLWQGQPGSPDAQYGGMEVESLGYAPCVTSPRSWPPAAGTGATRWSPGGTSPARCTRTAGACGSTRTPRGGLGVPWADLRRIATGLERMPAGPLRLSEPAIELPQFYGLLTQHAHRTPAVRSLRRAWVQPALGSPYLAVGLDLYDASAPALESVREMMRQSVGVVPEGVPVCTVALADEHDPVAMWLRAQTRPFYDREGQAPAY